MEKIRIAGRDVGPGAPVFIIAEAGINHNGSLDLALRLIDAAAEAGCDAVKFQKRSVSRLLTREAYEKPYVNGGQSYGRTYGEHRERLELSTSDFRRLQARAAEREILFFASAWDEESADFLESLDVPVHKIGSPDLTNLPLCAHVARKGLPVILSTGMSEMWEVERAVETILAFNPRLILMHCVSIYPAPPDKLRLPCIEVLRDRFHLPVGYSGHELGWSAVIAAVALGACVVEKHITLDRTLKGGDHHFSLEPSELSEMVRHIRMVEQALSGRKKSQFPEEMPFRHKLGKSVVTTRPVRAGERIRREMLVCKSPATGISPIQFDRLIGRKAAADIAEDSVIRPCDLDGR